MRSRTLPAIFERARKPEYTGENRCYPCTILNALIAVGLAAGLAVLWIPAGIAAIGVFGALIYLWGYLIPGTPELTQQYFPTRVLRWFGKDQLTAVATTDMVGERQPKRDSEELLVTSGVVEECVDEDDLCLTDSFSQVWWRRIRRFRDTKSQATVQLAAVLEVDPEQLMLQPDGDVFTAAYGDNSIGQWRSDAAFYADLAVEPTLSEWIDDWEGLPDRQRTELIAGMRAFLESCPACEAKLDQIEDVRRSCCSGDVVSVSVECEECGAELLNGSYR